MAKLTESYLRNMIKKTMNEMYEDDYDSFSENESEMESSSHIDQLIGGVFEELKGMMEDAEYDDQSSVSIPMASMKSIVRDLGEISNYLVHHAAGEDYKNYSMGRTARRTGTPHKYSAGPHVSPTMDESRKRTTTNKVAPKRK